MAQASLPSTSSPSSVVNPPFTSPTTTTTPYMPHWSYANHQCPPNHSDHIYKSAPGNIPIPLRIFPCPSAPPNAPFVLYFHGGAFAAGNHFLPKPWMVPGFREKGVHFVSVGYRLTPHAGILDMLEDGKDALAWCRSHLPEILGEGKVDVERYVISGESAGGQIAVQLASSLSPKPKAVICIYGPTNLIGFAKSGAKNNQPLTERWSEEEIKAEIDNPDHTKAITVCPFQFDIPIEHIRTQWAAPEYNYDERQLYQYELKKYMRTHGLLWDVMMRRKTFDSDDDYFAAISAINPIDLLDTPSGSKYPPTWFLYGIDDFIVPLSHAQTMAAKLKEKGIDFGESYEPGMGHEFDNKYTGKEVEGWDKYIQPILDFCERHLRD